MARGVRASSRAKPLGWREGSTAVEFGLVAPALFILLFGVVEFGRLVWTQSCLHFDVEEAARCASVGASGCGTAGQIATFAAGRATEINLTASNVSVSTPACGHQVTASMTYTFIASGFFPQTPALTAKACFP